MKPIAILIGVGLLQACSTGTYERTECAENLECRSAFGIGAVCGGEGYCEIAELHPRCQTVYPSDLTLPIDPTTTYLVGSVFDHTSETHVARYQSAQLAAIQANGNDGLDGHDFAMIHCSNAEDANFDELDKGAASAAAAVWLTETLDVPVIIGPASSTRTELVYNAVANLHDTLIISPSATSPSLTPLDGLQSTDADPGLLWRTAPPDGFQGEAIARDMANFDPLGVDNYRTAPSTNVAVIFQSGAYGDGLQEAFSSAFMNQNALNQTSLFVFEPENGSARAEAIAGAAEGNFDEVLFISSDAEDYVAFLQAAILVLPDSPLFLPDGGRNGVVLSDSLAEAGGIFSHVRGTAPETPSGAVYNSFTLSYNSNYGGTDVSVQSFTAQSFDAMWLAIYGHAWAQDQHGEVTGTNIARGLRHISSGQPTDIQPSSWNFVKSTFRNGGNVDVFGASGPLNYQQDGEISASIEVWTINPAGDGFNVVDTISP